MPCHALELAPFQGLRYISPDVDRFVDEEFDIARLLAPPYDIPGAQEARELQHSDPHNAARITLPYELGRESHPRYRRAAQLLHSWIEEGVLAQDDEPALYVYEQTAPDGTHQRGLIGALGLDSPVRPHEDVAEPPVRDRFRLMRATRADLEPIFLLYRGRDGAASKATQEVDGTPLVSATLRDGSLHRLWAITEPAILERIGTDLSRRPALIADGHHRYAAHRQLLREDPDLGWRHGLALLVDSDTHPPHLGAIHRVLPGVGIEQALDLANAVAEVVPSDLTAPQDGLLLVSPKGHGHLVRAIDPRALVEAMPDRSPEWRNLPTAALHEVLLPLWGVPEEQVRMVHDDPDQARATARETQGIAVLVPPLSVEQVYAVADRGELTPRKSTSFGPKPRTGLVMRVLDTTPGNSPST